MGGSMKKAFMWVGIVVAMSGLFNLGTIRKKEDPITKTQTDPISVKQKMEEMKGGPKGAPAPSMNLYPKEQFLTDPPVERAKEEAGGKAAEEEKVPAAEEVSTDDESEDWWSEDQ